MGAAAATEPATLFEDLAPGRARDEGSSPGVPVAAGGRIYFDAHDEVHGREVWTVDAELTAESATLLRDLCPGRCDGIEGQLGLAGVELDGALIFSNRSDLVSDPLHTPGLWRTFGTAESTSLLVPGLAANLRRLDDRVVFTLWSDELARLTLWATTGEPAGTRQLSSKRVSWAILRAGDRIFYFVETRDDEIELWSTDGTPAGTRRVSGWEDDGPPLRVTVAGDRIFFLIGDDLWTSGGSEESTRKLRSVDAGSGFERGMPLPVVDDKVFFLVSGAGSDLWVSDGTVEGTRGLRKVCAEPSCSLRTVSFSGPKNTATANGRLFFVGQDEEHGRQVWVSDGTPEGTRPTGADALETPRDLHAVGDIVFFVSGNLGSLSRELWRTDGTEEGTERLLPESFIERLTPGAEVLYFVHFDSLWKSDGTPAGTAPVTSRAFSRLDILAEIDGNVFFDGGIDEDLWVSDGTDAGTRRLRDFGGVLGKPSAPAQFTALGERFFFTANEPSDSFRVSRGLWASDGTPAGTARLFDDGEPSEISLLATTGDLLFFTADFGLELWVSDGTAAGSERLSFTEQIESLTVTTDRLYYVTFFDVLGTSDGTAAGTYRLPETANGSGIQEIWTLQPAGDLLFFHGDSERERDHGLFVTDGTIAGTVRLADADVSGGLTAFDGRVYSSGPCGELWVSDGTASGTSSLDRFGNAQRCNKRIRSLAATARGVFVLTSSDQRRTQLWHNDGTPEGSRLLRDLPALPRAWDGVAREVTDPPPRLLVAAGEHVYFAVDSPASGFELWASDGEVTGMVRDICPGPCGSLPHYPSVIDGRLFFAASDGVSGWEPWVSDGSGPGTRRLADIAPGATSSSPRQFFAFGDVVFLQADDLTHGSEPWTLTPSTSACDGDPLAACLLDDRFRVAVRWRAHDGTEGDGVAVPLTDETSLYWFFSPSNLELAVKLLDGRAINEHFWFFSGGLSDVEYWVDVTDLESGETRTYHNPLGEICGQRDLQAFFGGDAATVRPTAWRRAPAPSIDRKQGSCVTGPRTLCLLGGRFQVEVEWKTADGEGQGTALTGTDQTGFFWFFSPDNVELVVKALDGRAINDRFWIFYGALTDVEYTMTVTDTVTGAQSVYYNPPGEICGRGDTAAF